MSDQQGSGGGSWTAPGSTPGRQDSGPRESSPGPSGPQPSAPPSAPPGGGPTHPPQGQYGPGQYGQGQYGPGQYGQNQYGQNQYGPYPPGGHVGGWQQLPPEQVARMNQPGVVPLRPLYLGDIFGGSLQTMRRNPRATIGMGLIVLAVLLVPSLLVSLALTRALSQGAQTDLQVLGTLITLLFSSLSSVALTGMIVHVIGEAVLGDRAGLGETWRAVRGRLPALIGTVLLMGLLWTVGIAALVVVVVALVTGASAAGGSGAVGLGLLTAVVVLAGVVLAIWVGSRLSLAPAPVVLEKVGPWEGLRRAWRLTQGRQSWRVVGITLLAGLVTAIFSLIITFPLSILALAVLGTAGITSTLDPTMLVIDHLSQLVVGAVTIPFTAGVTALLYLDQRIRREGLDVSLSRVAHERAARRTR